MSLPTITYTSFDYESLKASLIAHVQKYFPDDWTEFIEPGLGMCFLELTAWVGDDLAFYLNRQANEQYLDTATQRRNIINLALMLGYTPRTATAASVPIEASVQATQSDDTVVPAYTSVSDQNGTPYEFLEPFVVPAGDLTTIHQQVTNEIVASGNGVVTNFHVFLSKKNITVGSVTLTFTVPISAVPTVLTAVVRNDGTVTLPGGGVGLLDYETGQLDLFFGATEPPSNNTYLTATYQWSRGITAYQGATGKDDFSSTGGVSQSFTLTRRAVLVPSTVVDEPPVPDPSRFEVWIGDPGSPFGGATGALWKRIPSIVEALSTDLVYEVVFNDDDTVSVLFGDGVNGAIPPVGVNNLHMIYRSGGGLVGNISTGFLDSSVQGTSGILSITVRVRNYQAGSGGAERETADEIRYNAPKFAATLDRATTSGDFTTLAALYSVPGIGTIARANTQLTPPAEINMEVVEALYVLGLVPVTQPLTYFLALPGAPIVLSTVSVQYKVGGVTKTVTAVDLGTGLAKLTGDATCDDTATRFRYDAQEFTDVSPGGFAGDGATIAFTASPPKLSFPILPSSVIVKYLIGGVVYYGQDDGAGNLTGTKIGTGTINYSTGDAAITFGSRASITSQKAQTYNFNAIAGGGNVTLTIKIDGGGNQTVTFAAGDFANYAACTAIEVKNKINALPLVGGLATVVGGKVVVTSNAYGSTSQVQVTGGTANNATNGLNFSTTAVFGVSYPPDSGSLITFDYTAALKLVLLNAPDIGSDILFNGHIGPAIRKLPSNNAEVYVWSYDADGNLVPASVSLRDALKGYLDLRREICSSVEVLGGFNVLVNVTLTVTYEPTQTQAATNAAIVAALEEFFAAKANVTAGQMVPLAALYDAIFPLTGVAEVVVQSMGLRVPVATGDGATALFVQDTTKPGRYVSSGKLPMLAGAGKINVYIDTVQAGTSDGATPTAGITAVGGLMLPNSTVKITDGTFSLRFNPAPALDAVVSIDFLLDQASSALGIALWNVDVQVWEIAVLGSVTINGTKVK